jgi:hypothetical protein
MHSGTQLQNERAGGAINALARFFRTSAVPASRTEFTFGETCMTIPNGFVGNNGDRHDSVVPNHPTAS